MKRRPSEAKTPFLETARQNGRIAVISAAALVAAIPTTWLPVAAGQPTVRLDFTACEIGKPPAGWPSWNGSAASVYSIRSEGDKKFLHADAGGTAVQIGHEMSWPLKELPFLEWQWRAMLFPGKSDERKKATDDSVLGLYVVFGRAPLVKAIKYIWSDALPVGTALDSPFTSRTKMIVLESGRELAGKWVTERRDVLADYRRLFGDGESDPVAKGIAVLTDADNTNSHAVGDYGDIQISGPGQNGQK